MSIAKRPPFPPAATSKSNSYASGWTWLDTRTAPRSWLRESSPYAGRCLTSFQWDSNLHAGSTSSTTASTPSACSIPNARPQPNGSNAWTSFRHASFRSIQRPSSGSGRIFAGRLILIRRKVPSTGTSARRSSLSALNTIYPCSLREPLVFSITCPLKPPLCAGKTWTMPQPKP